MNVRSKRLSEEARMGRKRVLLSKSELDKLRVKARRRGVWFKALSRVERGLMDLAIRVVEKVRSRVLARSLISVVEKLLSAMESEVARLKRTVGPSLARR
ncbi:hypothetical protein GTO27_03205, partial [Candidatus Bathyarchaeota archaeon]|nr:hypothetical protein [Candidatus Bathyarchaeota archaeon]